MDKFKSAQVKKLPDGRHSDGRGLYLHVVGGSRFWVFRYTSPITKRRREMSLGPIEFLTLAEARERRDDLRKLVRAGVDPLDEKAKPAMQHDLAAWVARWLHANQSSLKGGGAAGKWDSPVRVHILPRLGDTDVRNIRAGHIVDVLRPIWTTKVSAAAKAIDRLGIVMRYAAAYVEDVDRMAVPDARQQLGDQRHRVTHIESMPWAALPAFYAKLGQTPVELSIRLLILTATRPGSVRQAREDEFDLDRQVWTIPTANLKFKPTPRRPHPEPFKVPLSSEACRVVETALPLSRNGWLFTARAGKPLSDAAGNKFLTTMGISARSHGFRSSFRSWCQDHRVDRDIAETSLGHVVGDTVEATYARSNLLDLRREVMDRWARYVTTRK